MQRLRGKAKDGSPKAKPCGRSAPITPEQERTLLHLVSIAAYPAEAARQIGVTPQAITNRKKNTPAFASALERADATAQLNLVAQVVRAAQEDWRAAIAILERRWPELWSKPEVRAQLGIASLQPADVQPRCRPCPSRSALRLWVRPTSTPNPRLRARRSDPQRMESHPAEHAAAAAGLERRRAHGPKRA